jgi:pSer/pThr/pTyr-binding forkhead associated (FHA) protein
LRFAAQSDKPAPSDTPVTRRLDQANMLTLVHPGSGRTFNVLSGDVVGQKHRTSQAHVQIEGMADVDAIHRQHCRFILREGQWHVQPIDQRDFRPDKATNRTYVNRVFVLPGTEHPIRNGDQLRLAEVTFNILTLSQ